VNNRHQNCEVVISLHGDVSTTKHAATTQHHYAS